MLWTIIVILVVLWLLGLIGHVGGSLIHLLLVVAADAFTGFFRLNEVALRDCSRNCLGIVSARFTALQISRLLE